MKRRWLAIPPLVALGGLVAGCSLGDGTGDVRSDNLFAQDCWEGAYDLHPDFFAAVPFRNALEIRIQRGGDLEDRSDGMTVLIDDVADIRQNKLGQPVNVTLPRGVHPPGVPIGALCGPDGCTESGIHVTLYLLNSCHNENTVLYGLSGTMTFKQLFSGDPNEKDAAKKLTEADFDLMVGDPQLIVTEPGPDQYSIPHQSHIVGRFRFFFQRGQPAQPFP